MIIYRESAEMPDYTEPRPRDWLPFKRFVAKGVLVSFAEIGSYLFCMMLVALPPSGEHVIRNAGILWGSMHCLALTVAAIVVPIRWAVRVLKESES